MNVRDKNVKVILDHYKEIALLGKINAVLSYDTNVSLPEKGSEGRAKQSAYITKLISDKWLDSRFQEMVQGTNLDDLSDDEMAIVRNLRHAGKYYFKVPQKTIVEISEETSKAFISWQKARERNDFKSFLPHLVRLIQLNREVADHMGYKDNPYDALLDMYEPELKASEFEKIVKVLQPALAKLLQKISESTNFKRELPQGREFDIRDQERLTHFVLSKMGYDFSAGRQDVSAHPFTETLGAKDIRITNRYKSDSFVESVMVAMHEGGHALYEQGVNPLYENTPLEGGVSLGIHESQSRFWENQIGRSREFVEYMEPIFRAYYPKQFEGVTVDDLYLHFNSVQRGLIRVEADEVTYNLHIALRFEIENALINGKLDAKDLPQMWNAKMKEYLGVTPSIDADGCLQDVHWSYGNFGYFPTYTLGNLYAAQFSNALKKDLEMEDLVLIGDFEPVLAWFREKIHQHGSRYISHELCTVITGEDLNPQYFIDYLESKYLKLYS